MLMTNASRDAVGALQRNRLLLNSIQALRAFATGYFAILFALYVQRFGIHALGIGLFAAFSVILGIAYTLLFTRWASHWGSRRFLMLSSLLMILAGILYANAHSVLGLVLASLCGFVPPGGGLFFNALEEGLLAQTPAEMRTKVFATYGFIGTAAGAIGALASGLPAAGILGSVVAGERFLLWGFAAIGAGMFFLSALLIESRPGERKNQPTTATGKPLHRSRGIVYRLAALFVADSMGSGMVATPLLVYWLHQHFHMNPAALASLFFGMDILSAVSFPLAERIAGTIGLLNTAVFTHIPSSLFLMLVPFAPNAGIAAALLLARGLLVEMDVPTRQSYIASVVDPDERAAAAGVTSVGKQIGRAIGPVIGGLALDISGAVVPFVLGGAIKITYDLILWKSFRQVKGRG